MGWDAYAGNHVRRKYVGDLKPFIAADRRLARRKLTRDGLLHQGGLDCSTCAVALESLTGFDAYDPHGWSPDKVIEGWNQAKVTQPYIRKTWDWAHWSAYEFLKTCAKQKCGIWFCW